MVLWLPGHTGKPPKDWQEVRWYFPKSISVDRGRDALQDRADVAAGLMSHEEFHGRYGDQGEEGGGSGLSMKFASVRFRLSAQL